jgi:hypothetical protein
MSEFKVQGNHGVDGKGFMITGISLGRIWAESYDKSLMDATAKLMNDAYDWGRCHGRLVGLNEVSEYIRRQKNDKNRKVQDTDKPIEAVSSSPPS